MWPLQLTYSPQLLAKYIQSQNINPTNKCFPIVGRINTITIYIYIFNFNIFPQCIYLYWIYSGNNYMLYLRVSLFCKTVFVTSGSQFSRGPNWPGTFCRTNILQNTTTEWTTHHKQKSCPISVAHVANHEGRIDLGIQVLGEWHESGNLSFRGMTWIWEFKL